MQVQPFLFLHIPKTGGMTFHGIIRRQFYRSKRYTIVSNKHVAHWNGLGAEEKRKFGVVKGHFWWQGTAFHPDEAIHYTFLRDPEKRIKSHYYHVLPLHHRGEMLTQEFGEGHFSLKDLLLAGKFLRFDNCSVRFLSGNIDKPWDSIDDSDLQLAIKNFDEKFQHFGLQERYDESLMLLQYELGWKAPYYVSLNITGESVRKEEEKFDAETLELIKHFSRFDRLLWEHGKKRFEEKLALHGEKLQRDVTRFQTKNRRNVFLRSLYHRMFGLRSIQ